MTDGGPFATPLEAAADAPCRNRFGVGLDDKTINSVCRQRLIEGAQAAIDAFYACAQSADAPDADIDIEWGSW